MNVRELLQSKKEAVITIDTEDTIGAAARAYAADVETGSFPGEAETVRMDDAVLDEALGRGASDRAADDPSLAGIPLDRDL